MTEPQAVGCRILSAPSGTASTARGVNPGNEIGRISQPFGAHAGYRMSPGRGS